MRVNLFVSFLGEVIGNSMQSPVLLLSNLVPGRYQFHLNVSDKEGLSSVDSAYLVIKPDPHSMEVSALSQELQMHVRWSRVKRLWVLGLPLWRDEAKMSWLTMSCISNGLGERLSVRPYRQASNPCFWQPIPSIQPC